MTELVFEPAGDDHFRVAGRLAFDTVHVIWESSRSALKSASAPVVDLGEVTQMDSAGLALLLEWVGWAHADGKKLMLANVPSNLMDLARMSEVDDLFTQAIAA